MAIPDLTTQSGALFAAAFAVQHLNEVLDKFYTSLASNDNQKKLVVGIGSVIFGITAAISFDLRIVAASLKWASEGWFQCGFDVLITGAAISAGTEGVNSVLKYANYAKEQKKADASDEKKNADGSLDLVNRQPVPAAPK